MAFACLWSKEQQQKKKNQQKYRLTGLIKKVQDAKS